MANYKPQGTNGGIQIIEALVISNNTRLVWICHTHNTYDNEVFDHTTTALPTNLLGHLNEDHGTWTEES